MKNARKVLAIALSLLLLFPSLAMPTWALEVVEDYVLADFKYTTFGGTVEKGIGTGSYYLQEAVDLSAYATAEKGVNRTPITAPDVYLQMDINATYSSANGTVFLQPHCGSNKLVNAPASTKEKVAMDKLAGKWYTVSAPLDTSVVGNNNDGIDVSDIQWMTYYVPAASSIQVQNLRIVKMTATEIRTELTSLIEEGLPEDAVYASIAEYESAVTDAQTLLANENAAGVDLMTAWNVLRAEKNALVDISSINTKYYAVDFPAVSGSDEDGVYTWAFSGGVAQYPSANLSAVVDISSYDIASLRFQVDMRLVSGDASKLKEMTLQPYPGTGGTDNQWNYTWNTTLADGEWHTFESTIPVSWTDISKGTLFTYNTDGNAVTIQVKDMRIVNTFCNDIRAELKTAATEVPEGEYTAESLTAYQEKQAAGLTALEDKTADYVTYRNALNAINTAKSQLVDTAYFVGYIPTESGGDYDTVTTWILPTTSENSAFYSPTLEKPMDLSAHTAENLRYRVDVRLASGDASKLKYLITQPQNTNNANFENYTYYNLDTTLADGEWHTFERDFSASISKHPNTWHLINASNLFVMFKAENASASATLEIRRMRIVDITNQKDGEDLQTLMATEVGDSSIYSDAVWQAYQSAMANAQTTLDAYNATNDKNLVMEELQTVYVALLETIDAMGSRQKLYQAINEALPANIQYSKDSLAAYTAVLESAKLVLANANAGETDIENAITAIVEAKKALVEITYLVAQFPMPSGTAENGVYTWTISGATNFPTSTLPEVVDLSAHKAENLRFRVDIRLVEGDASQLGNIVLQPMPADNGQYNDWDSSPKTVLADGEWHTFERDFMENITHYPNTWYRIAKMQFHLQTSATVTLEVKNIRIVDITAEENLGDLNIDGSGFVNITGDLEYGGTDTLTATPTGNTTFVGWNNNGSFTRTESISLEASKNQKVSAYFVDADETAVIYYGKYNRIIDVQIVNDASQLVPPAIPYIYGYTSAGWDTPDNDLAGLVNGNRGGSVSLTANYVKDDNHSGYTVKVETAEVTNGVDVSVRQSFDTCIVVRAAGSGVFSHWELDGMAVGYDESYTFYVSGDNTIKAIYVTDDTQKASPALSACIKRTFIQSTDDAYTISMIAQTYLPNGMTLLDYGLLFTHSSTIANDIAAGKLETYTESADYLKVVASSRIPNRQYQVDLLNVKANKTRYGIAYITARNADGEIVTVYSDPVAGSTNV